jgi:hypothetical protein
VCIVRVKEKGMILLSNSIRNLELSSKNGRIYDVTIAKVERMAYPLPQKPSIAVLPFTNMSGDPAREYIGDGISENITGFYFLV